jgi:hypothetical protein
VTKRNEFIDKWVEALRSGKYKQGRGQLWTETASDDSILYCCLGVAAMQDPSITEKCEGTQSYLKTPNTSNALVNLGVSEFVDNHEDDLIAFNDDHKWSFSEIADYIEEEFYG